MHSSIDTSTLNLKKVKSLPKYANTKGYKLGSYGSGCYLDAPGFPSYMIQALYTRNGNTPDGAPEQVLELDGVLYVVEPAHGVTQESHEKPLHRLYKPLPIDHIRVQMWMANVYRYFHNCYRDKEAQDKMMVFPLPNYKLETPTPFSIKPGAPEAELSKIQAKIDAELARCKAVNEARLLHAEQVAIPENHLAVITIRKFYPDYEPNLNWIDCPLKSTGQEDWWETSAQRPEAEECMHRNALDSGSFSATWVHPKAPGKHCLWCGRTNPE